MRPVDFDEASVSFTRRRLLRAIALGGAAFAAVPIVNTYRFEVSRHRVSLAGLTAPLRVAHLSDLHFGPFIREGSVRAWVDATLRERPDLIVITGDFFDHLFRGDGAPLLRLLARLSAPLGVFGVWGNHDNAIFGFDENGIFHPDWRERRTNWGRALRASGVRILLNEGVRVRSDLYLAGIDDERTGWPDLARALAGRRGETVLLLSHTPDALPSVPSNVALTLCGHTHGGQVKLPVVGPLVTSSRYGRRFAEGFVRAPALGFVSRGLGVSNLPLRLDCPAEVAMLELTPR
ncbi:metallophosphoesterase [Deinococcus yavapaiensis]|uniref:Calcineurin-like phosphoesterase domain-containing protein n=1 Tax=Deinococcus yavapaiensis KR-236 TaxID=694435 RepID=A0A318SEY9_9DEIO|nr:metallophosphoesterase [Deinococcus yavapaiensis]PYE55795.1 hypothetical protein DES52_102160 [Deinococcus yavapaiensis KR-236]